MPGGKYFVLFLLGVFFCFAADTAITDVSSSFNIDEGVGTTSLAVCYGMAVVVSLVTPILGNQVGCKRLLMIGAFGFLIYILANLYSRFATLVPAGLFLGLGEAWVWTALPIVTAYFAKQQQNQKESFDFHLRRFTAFYLTAIEISTFAGSALSFAVLHIDRSLSNQSSSNNASESRDLTVCGANDCQLANITRANNQRYHPVHPLAKHIFVAIVAGMNVTALFIFYFYVPDDIDWDLEENEENYNNTTQVYSAETKQSSSDIPAKSLVNSKAVAERQERECGNNQTSICSLLVQSVVDSFKLAVSGKHLLVVLLPLYNGTSNGFLFGELTRAFASCILGVDYVGLCMMIYAVTAGVACVLCGKFAARYGRNLPFLLATAIEAVTYVFCLNWDITTDNVWLVYIVFATFGVAFAVWNTLIVALYGEYFEDEDKLAYNLWNVLTSIGLMWQFAVSTFFCVYVKIYIQLGLLGAAMITYLISLVIFYPEQCRLIQTEKKKNKCGEFSEKNMLLANRTSGE